MVSLIDKITITDIYTPVHRRSPAIEFVWGSWSATAENLEKDGWEFQVSKNFHSFSCDVIGYHRHYKAKLYARDVPIHDLKKSKYDREYIVKARVILAESISLIYSNLSSFESVSMNTEFVTTTHIDVSKLFAPKEQKLIIPEDSVSGLLDKIKELQEPTRQARLKEQVQQRKKLDAQIII